VLYICFNLRVVEVISGAEIRVSVQISQTLKNIL
jgi:hypothetical protein